MADFIEVHQQGKTRLVNLDWVEEIWPTENGTQIYFAFTCPDATSQDFITTDESYDKIKRIIAYQRGRKIVLRDAEQKGVKRLRELAKADKEGRVAVLPCEVGGSMLNMIDIERPGIMKGLHFAVAYESIRGTIFYMPYDVFRENIDAGHVRPLHKLKEAQNGKSKLD